MVHKYKSSGGDRWAGHRDEIARQKAAGAKKPTPPRKPTPDTMDNVMGMFSGRKKNQRKRTGLMRGRFAWPWKR